MRLVLALLVLLGFTAATPLPRSVSSSRQFIIYGGEVALRGAFAEVAEQTKSNLLGVLQKRDEWKTPIVVNLQFPQANIPEEARNELRFSQTGFGIKIQLNLTITSDVNAPALQREVLRALLLEMIYRNRGDIAPGSPYVEAPGWLVDGIQALGSVPERESLAQALRATGDTNRVMSLDQFLRQKPELLDSPARQLYRAYSLALVQLLINQVDGTVRLGLYIDNLWRATNDPVADLRARFPNIGDASDLAAMWRSSVSTFAVTGSYQLLSFAETERQLEELLHFKWKEGKGTETVVQMQDLLGKKFSRDQKIEVARLAQRISLLTSSANPVLRPIVLEYQRCAELLAGGKQKDLTARLQRLKTRRASLGTRMDQIDDYMNWYEATQLQTKSGAFTEFLKAAQQAKQPEARRRDPLSVYLDAVEVQFEN